MAEWGWLEPLALSHLIRQKKGFRIPALAAEFEGAKVLLPRPLRDFRPQFHPKAEQVQVIETDVAVVHPLDQMVTDGSGEP
jgi:hypothetical protein